MGGHDTPLRVGTIGFGAIGQGVARQLQEQGGHDVQLVGALVRRAREASNGIRFVTKLDDLLDLNPEVVVEVAGHEALRAYGVSVLRAGCDLLLASVGALADVSLDEDLRCAAQNGRARIHVVSGAIGALDAIAAASIGGLTRVTHVTRKPAASLLDEQHAGDLSTAIEVFRGTAREGALRFPQSTNVAAAVSIAGIGMDKTEVSVVADPSIDRNQHEIEAEGAFGSLRFSVSNLPTELNPRSARLVSMSVVHALLKRRALISLA